MSLERLESLRRDMKKCVRCSLCKLVPMPTIQPTGGLRLQAKFTSACPPVDEYHFHAYSSGGMNVMALSLLDGRISVDNDLAQIISACTSCGMCDVSCKFIMAARELVEMGVQDAIQHAMGVPIAAFGVEANQTFGPACGDYHVWLARIKPALDPNVASDPFFYANYPDDGQNKS